MPARLAKSLVHLASRPGWTVKLELAPLSAGVCVEVHATNLRTGEKYGEKVTSVSSSPAALAMLEHAVNHVLQRLNELMGGEGDI